jgi:hypothetical protein
MTRSTTVTDQPPESATPRGWGTAWTTFAVWALTSFGVAFELDALAASLPLTGTAWVIQVQVYALLALAGLSWVGCQAWEWSNRHHPRRVQVGRRSGWAVQALMLVFTAWNCCTTGRADVLVGVAPALLIGLPLWRMWVAAQGLRESDRQAVAVLVAEQEYEFMQALREGGGRRSWDVPVGKHDPAVYFLRNGNRIKIGTTTDLRQRIRRLALRDDNIALVLHGGPALERALHGHFAALRIGNTEWFRSTKALNDFIAAHAAPAATPMED